MAAYILLGLALRVASGVAAAAHSFDDDHVSLIQAVDVQEPAGRRMQRQRRPAPRSSLGGFAEMRKQEAPQRQQALQALQAQQAQQAPRAQEAPQAQPAQQWPMMPMYMPAGRQGPMDAKTLRAELAKADRQLAEDLRLFITLRGEKEKLMAENTELQRVVAGRRGEMKSQAAAMESVKAKLEAANHAVSELRGNLAEKESAAMLTPTEPPTEPPTELTELPTELPPTEAPSSRCEEERDGVLRMQKQLNEALHKQQELEENSEAFRDLHQKLQDEKSAVVEEYTTVMKENTRLTGANSQLTLLNDELTKQNARLKGGLDQFKGVLQNMP